MNVFGIGRWEELTS